MSMPLTMVPTGEPNVIKKIGGKEETRRFLENLGFVTGGMVTVVSEIGNFKGCTVWKNGQSQKTCRRRSGKKTYHGYGNHKRCGRICP